MAAQNPPPLLDALNALSITELRSRLLEAEETLNAIRNGEVDAVVIGGKAGQRVYTLENADRPYRVLIEQMQEGALTLSKDGTVLYCNERMALMLGTLRETLLGAPVHRLFIQEDVARFEAMLSDVIQGSPATSEFTLSKPGYVTTVPVNISLVDLMVEEGASNVVCCVVTDLTHNTQRNHELSAANARLAKEIEVRRSAEDSLQLALDAAGMGSWDLNLATGMARRTLRHDQIFGYETLQPTWGLETSLTMFEDADRADVVHAFSQAQTTGSVAFEKRIRRHGDGAQRWISVKGRTHYAKGKAVRIAGVVSDITDYRAIEDQLRQAQKMEAVGQLTGGVAHDFNNLLMVISGSLDLLRRRVPDDPKTARLFDVARQGIERGSKLNQQLLAFSRRQDLHAETVCVATLIPAFEHLLQRAIGETITMTVSHEDHPWFCKTDPHQLETSILNLAINARDAMPNGGAIALVTRNRTVDAQEAINLGTAPGDYVVVAVTDNGSGMSEDVLNRIFDPFFTTKPIGKGTGLGLSQVYGFAKQSGGFVTVDSEVDHGTTVSIHLPRGQASALPAAAPVQPAVEVCGEGTILLVEDDADVRATARFMLEDLGYDVQEAGTGQAALKMLKEGAKPALVLSDVIMPDGMSGIELARTLLVSHPNLPVLLTSGYTAQQLLPDASGAAHAVLRKPYTQSELSQALRRTLQSQSPTLRAPG